VPPHFVEVLRWIMNEPGAELPPDLGAGPLMDTLQFLRSVASGNVTWHPQLPSDKEIMDKFLRHRKAPEEPVAEEPTEEEPETPAEKEETVAKEPVNDEPVDEEPADEEPETPAAPEEPADPVDEEPAEEEPVEDEPVMEDPEAPAAPEEPAVEEPVDEEPVPEEPTDEMPAAPEEPAEEERTRSKRARCMLFRWRPECRALHKVIAKEAEQKEGEAMKPHMEAARKEEATGGPSRMKRWGCALTPWRRSCKAMRKVQAAKEPLWKTRSAATSPEAPEEQRSYKCTMRTVTDAACGMENVLKQVSVHDVTQCPTKRQCQRVCSPKTRWTPSVCRNECANVPDVPCNINMNVLEAKTCEVPHKCPFRLKAMVAGQADLTDLDDTEVEVHIAGLTVEQGEPVVKNLINSRSAVVMPLLDQVLQTAKGTLNTEIKKQIGKAKQDVIDSVKKQHVGRFFKFINPVDADDAITRVLSGTMAHLQGTLKSRAEVAPPPPVEMTASQDAMMCTKHLRVRVKGGETYIFKDWNNAVFARKYDSTKKCDTVYTAQCHSGYFYKTKQCPFEEPTTEKVCIRGSSWRCWSAHEYVIEAHKTKVVAIPQPDDTELPLLGAELIVDTVDPATMTRTVGLDDPEETNVLSGKDLHGADTLDEELEMKVPGFQATLSGEMCKNAGNNNKFGITKSLRKWTCRTLFNGVSHFARWHGTYKIADMDRMSMKLDMRKDLTAAVVPNWPVVERKAEGEVEKALEKQTLPMDAKLSKVTISIGGVGHTLEVKPATAAYLDAVIDMSLLGQLGNIGNMAGNLGDVAGGAGNAIGALGGLR